MTAIVGWLCKDGVVIGSDSGITLVAGTQPTIEQTGNKISIIRARVIVSGSGEVGLQQRFCNIVDQAFEKKVFTNKHIDVGRYLAQNANNDLANSRAERGRYCALLAYASGDEFYLCEFSIKDFQPEWKSPEVNFASIGCGQQLTDSFLGFMKKVFWKDNEQPTVAQAKFITYWTLSLACELSPGFIRGPIHIAQLHKDGTGHFVATEIDKTELLEHDAALKDATDHLAKFKDRMTGKTAEKIPSIGTS